MHFERKEAVEIYELGRDTLSTVVCHHWIHALESLAGPWLLSLEESLVLTEESEMASAEVKLVLSTVSDGRARDLRFRQNQFHSLHRWITTHAGSIEAAARNDDRVSDLQTKFMVSLTLRDLKKNYEELNLKQALQAEYSVKNGRNNAYGSIPEDLIYIIPERYTPFYSVLTALFACIAAGSMLSNRGTVT